MFHLVQGAEITWRVAEQGARGEKDRDDGGLARRC